MNKIIQNALSKQDIKYYWIERQPNVFPCVVYAFNEYVQDNSDNRQETLRYDCYFNLYTKDKLMANTEKIKKALLEAGFTQVVINNPIKFDDLDYYQITMNFMKTKKAS